MHDRILILVVGFGLAAVASAEDEQPAELEPLYVESAVITDRTADELAHPVEVLAGKELQRRRAGTIGDMLGNELGVSNSSFGPGVGRPVIRGQGGPRVQVLENNIRSMDISTISADHAVSVDPLTARQVEVIKGPATLIYGSGASGGVVNVLNNRMPKFFLPGFQGNAGFSYADNARERLGSVDITHGWDNFALQADLAIRRSSDFDIPGTQDIEGEGRRGVLENSSVDNYSGAISFSWLGQRGNLGMALSRLDYDYGLPEIIDPDDPEFERIELEQTRYDLRGELIEPLPGFTRARVAFGYNRYEQQEIEFEDDEREIEADFDNEEFDLRLDLSHVPVGPFAGVIGAHFTDRDFRAEGADGEAFFVPPTVTRSQALFVVEEMPLDWGRFEFGARVERNRSNPDDEPARSFTLFSASFGILWDIDELHHLRFGYNRAERAPAAEELFARGRHAAAGTFEIGEANLGTETANEFDLGLDRHGERWNWRAHVFYNRVDDFIFPEFQVDEDGEIIMVNDEGLPVGRQRNRLVNYRQRNAEFYGLEAETRYKLLDNGPLDLDIRIFGDHVRGKLRGDGDDLPRITPTRFGVSFDGGIGAWDGFVELSRANRQGRIGQGETPTDKFTLLGFDIGYTVRGRAAQTRFYLRGRNLLDSEVRLHTSFLKDESPQPGRTLLAGVSVDF